MGGFNRVLIFHSNQCAVKSNDVDSSVTDEWCSKIGKIYEGYEPRNIFNLDEMGLFSPSSSE